MALDYRDLLTVEQKHEILTQRISQWAANAFAHDLDRTAILAAEPGADVSVQNKAIADLTSAIETAQAELAALE